MSPILLTRSQIDDAAWNALVQDSPQCVIYAFTYYLDIVCVDWKALVYSAGAGYQVVMPLPVRKSFGFELVYQPLFCQYLGLFSRGQITGEQAALFLKALSRHYSYISAYHFNPDNDRLLDGLNKSFPEFQTNTYVTHWLDLTQTYCELSAGFNKDRRKNLRKAEAARWELVASTNIHPLIYLFVSNHSRKIPGGVNPNAFNVLEALHYTFNTRAQAEVWYAAKSGRIHAGILLIRSGGKVIYLFNAADDTGRRENARTFLLDQYFREFCTNAQIFDFESPRVKSISDFYKSLGGEAVPFPGIRKNRLPFPLRQIQEWRINGLKTS
ncbi:GNAT family N-acetyltransferase [Dyadobacter crusticola]|uniref:GNAT family N-acetyltransferase n=1 Tax=Dyadobacter crusticola TaxID=292407 RepID=UPI0004E26EC3|nr:GNAT family N-acetyltransferase [Dyadobacter crusticola]